LSDCINVTAGTNNTSVDFGLYTQATDVEITKVAVNQYVTSGDTANFVIKLKNTGGSVVKKYTIIETLPAGLTFDGLNTNDKIQLAYWLS